MPFEDLLNDAIVDEINELNNQEVGSDSYKIAVEGVTKLMDRAIEIRKIDEASEKASKDRDHETDLKQKQLDLDTEKLEFERKKFEFERKKFETEVNAQVKAREVESKLKQEQMRDERIDKIARNVLTGFTFGGTMFTIWCLASATFTFEEKGTITSSLGRKVLGMLVPKL